MNAPSARPQQQLLPQATQADTTAQARPAAEDTSAIAQLGEDLSAVTRHILEGNWEQLRLDLYGLFVERLVDLVPRLLAALLVLVILYGTYRLIGNVLRRILNRARRIDPGLQGLLMKTYRVVAFVFIFIMVLDQFDFNVTALIAGLSIAGIAVGFAARDSIENFISGVTILLDRPFRVGDNIEIENRYGAVEEITLRSTRLRTRDNQIVVMPNTLMISQRLINHTMLKTLRVTIPFGIGYGESPEEARAVLLKLVEGDERLHPDYPSSVVVRELGASSVDMALRIYLRNPKLEYPLRWEYTEKVFEALRAAGIEIPFPHLQLFIDGAKAFEQSFLMQPHPPRSAGVSGGGAGGASRRSEHERT